MTSVLKQTLSTNRYKRRLQWLCMLLAIAVGSHRVVFAVYMMSA